MKRICFIVDSIFSIGGVQRVTSVIAKELSKDYNVTIVTFDSPQQKDTSLYGLDKAGINYCFISYPPPKTIKNWLCKIYSGIYLKLQPQGKWWSDLYSRSSFPSELRDIFAMKLKEGAFDVIIGVHAPLAARLSTIKKELEGVKLIGWLHNSYNAMFGERNSYFGSNRKRHYIYQFLQLDNVVVLCHNDAGQFHKYDNYFMPTVIYNPLTLKPGKTSSGNSKRFLAVGRFTPLHKGIDILIKAFHLFTQKNNEWELDIVGEGPEKDYFNALIKQFNQESRIHIHPFTNHIQDYYSNAQVYVLSSRWEGMPLVLVEAMSHGLPIVTSNLPVCQEILGDFGLYFMNGDVQELAQRLEDATHMDWPAKSKEALEIASRFNIKHIMEQWKKVIEE